MVGAVLDVEPLAGLSGRTVVAIHGEHGAVVARSNPAPVEVAMAGDLGAALRDAGVRTPGVRGLVETDAGEQWLLQEHVPFAMPRERWRSDPDAVELLRRLHSMPAAQVERVEHRYEPSWSAETDELASTALGSIPDRWRREAASAQLSKTVISGDPNPLNWRLTTAGDVVLLDWERMTVASPVLDLAVSLPGLPTATQVEHHLELYGSSAGATVRDVMLAKAFTVIELAAGARPGSPARTVVDSIRDDFQTWSASELG